MVDSAIVDSLRDLLYALVGAYPLIVLALVDGMLLVLNETVLLEPRRLVILAMALSLIEQVCLSAWNVW